jgi:hypothetical protein
VADIARNYPANDVMVLHNTVASEGGFCFGFFKMSLSFSFAGPITFRGVEPRDFLPHP